MVVDIQTGKTVQEMSFFTKEPLGFAGSMNFYVYADGDSVNFVDVSGLKKVSFGFASCGIYISITVWKNGWILEGDTGITTTLVGGGISFCDNYSKKQSNNFKNNIAISVGVSKYLGIEINPGKREACVSVGAGIRFPLSVSTSFTNLLNTNKTGK